MNRTAAVIAGLVLSGLLALGDLSDVFQPNNPEPVVMTVTGSVLGLVTLVGIVLAWRRRRPGGVAVIVSRLLSGVGAFESFTVHGFHEADRIATGVAAAITLLAVSLVASGLRDAPARSELARR